MVREIARLEALRVRRLHPEDKAAVSRLLAEARFRRRTMFSGVHELHPVDWSARRRTFVVERGHTLVGTAELRCDDGDEEAWELSLALDRSGTGDGTRVTAAALFYAFETLGAETVWFWAPDAHTAVMKLARRFGFVRLHRVRLPAGDDAHAHELSIEAWRAQGPLDRALDADEPLIVDDGAQSWRATTRGFIRGG